MCSTSSFVASARITQATYRQGQWHLTIATKTHSLNMRVYRHLSLIEWLFGTRAGVPGNIDLLAKILGGCSLLAWLKVLVVAMQPEWASASLEPWINTLLKK